MLLKVKFEDPLTINVNVTITQKEDERVAKLENQMSNWLVQMTQFIKRVEQVSEQVDSSK